MSSYYSQTTSGLGSAYSKGVSSVRNKNERSDKINIVALLATLIVIGVGGAVVGYFITYSLLGLFFGLLIGSATAFGVCYLVFFFRKHLYLHRKASSESEEKSLRQHYASFYAVPSENFSGKLLGISGHAINGVASLAWNDKDEALHIVGKDSSCDYGSIVLPKEIILGFVQGDGSDNKVLLIANGAFLALGDGNLFDSGGLGLKELDDSEFYGRTIVFERGIVGLEETKKGEVVRSFAPISQEQGSQLSQLIGQIEQGGGQQ
jgi:hypothetical protein